MAQDLTLLQGVRGLINVVEGLNDAGVRLIDEEAASLCEELFDGERERAMLCDAEMLAVLRGVYSLCERHPTFLQIMSTYTVGGRCTTLADEPIELD